MRIGINCGHTLSGTIGGGASGYLDESNETRAVGYKLMDILTAQGHTVIDCTNNIAKTVNQNLSEICRLANAQPLDLFLSIHFNAGGGQGTEIFTNAGQDVGGAKNILKSVVPLGFRNRGIKDGRNLYVIKHTNATALLLEVCFVDTPTDALLYNKIGADGIARAIAEAITGIKVESEDLTMSQYEELKNQINDLTETVKVLASEVGELKNPMIYNYVDDNMPEWAKMSVNRAVSKGIIKGDGEGLGLTYSDLRAIVREDRAGLYN